MNEIMVFPLVKIAKISAKYMYMYAHWPSFALICALSQIKCYFTMIMNQKSAQSPQTQARTVSSRFTALTVLSAMNQPTPIFVLLYHRLLLTSPERLSVREIALCLTSPTC